MMISFEVTAKLICAFVFAYENCWFSQAVAQIKQIHCIFNLSSCNTKQLLVCHLTKLILGGRNIYIKNKIEVRIVMLNCQKKTLFENKGIYIFSSEMNTSLVSFAAKAYETSHLLE